MPTKTITDLRAQQAEQIFAILNSIPEGTEVKLFRRNNGRLGARVTIQRAIEYTVSGSSSRDVFAQACQALP